MKEGKNVSVKAVNMIFNVTVKYKTGNAFMCRMDGVNLAELRRCFNDSDECTTVTIDLLDNVAYTVRPIDVLHIESQLHYDLTKLK